MADLRAWRVTDPAAWNAFVEPGAVPRLPAAVGVGRGARDGRLAAGAAGDRTIARRARRGRPAAAAPGPVASAGTSPTCRAARSGHSMIRTSATACWRALRTLGREERIATVRADPEAEPSTPYGRGLLDAPWRSAPKVQPPTTRVIDLTAGEEALRADLKRKHRQYVNKAERAGVTIERFDGSTPPEVIGPALADFNRIYRSTAERRASWRVSRSTTSASGRLFAPTGRVRLAFAVLDGERVATIYHFTCGDRAVEAYGGMTDAGADARANYLLKWDAIAGFAREGFAVYDLWGLATGGIRQFKEGFGGREIEYVGARDLPLRAPIDAALRSRSPRTASPSARACAWPGNRPAKPPRTPDRCRTPTLLHPLVRDALASLGVDFEVMECDPALADTAAFVEAYGVPLDRSANTIVVASKGAEPTYVACVAAGDDVAGRQQRRASRDGRPQGVVRPRRADDGGDRHGDRRRDAVRPAVDDAGARRLARDGARLGTGSCSAAGNRSEAVVEGSLRIDASGRTGPDPVRRRVIEVDWRSSAADRLHRIRGVARASITLPWPAGSILACGRRAADHARRRAGRADRTRSTRSSRRPAASAEPERDPDPPRLRDGGRRARGPAAQLRRAVRHPSGRGDLLPRHAPDGRGDAGRGAAPRRPRGHRLHARRHREELRPRGRAARRRRHEALASSDRPGRWRSSRPRTSGRCSWPWPRTCGS